MPSLPKRVLIEWGKTEPGSLCYLGSVEDDLQMTVCLGTDANPDGLLLSFRLPVKVRLNPQSRNPRQKVLFFVIEADMFDSSSQEPCLSLRCINSSEIPKSTMHALALARFDLDSISRLRFRLRTPGKVFMPKAEQPFIPTSEKACDALVALCDLSQAKEFSVYVMVAEDDPFLNYENKQMPPGGTLRHLCEKVSSGQIKNRAIDLSSCPGYTESMACNAWEHFNLYSNIQRITRPQKGILKDNQKAVDPPPGYSEAQLLSANDDKGKYRAKQDEPLVDCNSGGCVVAEDANRPPHTTDIPLDLVLDQEEIETEDEDDLDIPPTHASVPDQVTIKRKSNSNNMQFGGMKKIKSNRKLSLYATTLESLISNYAIKESVSKSTLQKILRCRIYDKP
jgi:hypothetical protein